MEERRLTHILSHLSPSSRFPIIRQEKHRHGSSLEEVENSRYIFGLSAHGNSSIPLAVQTSSRRGALGLGCNEDAEYQHLKKPVVNETVPCLSDRTRLPQVSMNESSTMELSLSCYELTMSRCRSKSFTLEECRQDTFAKDEEDRRLLAKRSISSTSPHSATECVAQKSCICKMHQENQRCHSKDDGKDIDSQMQNVSSGEIQVNEIEAFQTELDERNGSQTASQNEADKHDLESEAGAQMERDGSERMTVSRNNAMTGERRPFVEDCIFCLIIQGRSPAFKLYEDDICICILDVHPITRGHSLIIPKAHFPSLEHTPPEVAAAMCAIVPFTSVAIMKATNCDSFNLIVNSGKAAGQVVFHTHFHIIPRRQGDNLWRSESVCRPTLGISHETSLLVQQIRHNLSGKGL